MIKEIGIQLFSVRDFMNTEEEIRDTLTKLKNMGYSQVQTAGCSINYKTFGEIASEIGLKIIGTHDNFNMMLNDFDKALENHLSLGTTNMGIGMYHFKTIDEVNDFIKKCNIIGERAAKHNMKFTYHNHSHEFFRWENGKTTMDMLVDGFDKNNISFVLDTYWVQHGGGDVRAWIEKLAGRIDILHLKDMKRLIEPIDGQLQAITELGAGNMNWSGILDVAEKSDVKYYVVEQDNNWAVDCLTSAKTSIDYLKGIMV